MLSNHWLHLYLLELFFFIPPSSLSSRNNSSTITENNDQRAHQKKSESCSQQKKPPKQETNFTTVKINPVSSPPFFSSLDMQHLGDLSVNQNDATSSSIVDDEQAGIADTTAFMGGKNDVDSSCSSRNSDGDISLHEEGIAGGDATKGEVLSNGASALRQVAAVAAFYSNNAFASCHDPLVSLPEFEEDPKREPTARSLSIIASAAAANDGERQDAEEEEERQRLKEQEARKRAFFISHSQRRMASF